MSDKLNITTATGASLITRPLVTDKLDIIGTFHAVCLAPDGSIKWEDDFHNLVVTTGKNQILDQSLAGSAWTATGPFMGLISSVSYSTIAAGDTQASHAGWTEAGSTNAPTFSARATTNGGWSAASAGSKALSTALSFAMTGAGTLKGAFLVGGSGAVVTLMNTSGTLISAGLFSGGDRAVLNGDTVNVSYSMSL